MSIASAFQFLINLKGRQMTLTSFSSGEAYTVRLAPSNYFRNMNALEEIVVEGFEFVASVQNLKQAGYGKPERGDYIIDSEYGENTIKEVHPLSGIAGEIYGYRIRTS